MLLSFSAGTFFIGPGESAIPGAGWGKAVERAMWNVPTHAMHSRNPRRSIPSLPTCLTIFLVMTYSFEWLRSLHHDLCGHVRMHRAEVPVGSGLGEHVGKFLIGVDRLGIELRRRIAA